MSEVKDRYFKNRGGFLTAAVFILDRRHYPLKIQG